MPPLWALWRDGVKKGLRFGTLLVPRGCAGLVTRLDTPAAFYGFGSQLGEAAVNPGRAPDSHWSGLENKTPCENLRVPVPLMTTQWGGCRGRLNCRIAASTLILLIATRFLWATIVKQARDGLPTHAAHPPHAPIGAAWKVYGLGGRPAAGQDHGGGCQAIISTTPRSPRQHPTKEFTHLSMSQQARLGAGRRTPCRLDRGRVHFVGSQARPQRYWDRTVGFHG
jgi:hypothetical protein